MTGDERVEGAIEAVDKMIEVVDGFEAYVVFAADRDEHGTRYRLNLLWIHAFAALMIAPLMSATGRDGLSNPSAAFLRTLPGAPYSLSAMIGAGGLVLGMGCIFRAKWVEVAGLIGLFSFYVLVSISIAVPPVGWLLHHHGVKPAFYGPVIYMHLAVIMAVHMWALAVRVRDEVAATAAMADAAAGLAHVLDDPAGDHATAPGTTAPGTSTTAPGIAPGPAAPGPAAPGPAAPGPAAPGPAAPGRAPYPEGPS